jgi:hypothetical protein
MSRTRANHAANCFKELVAFIEETYQLGCITKEQRDGILAQASQIICTQGGVGGENRPDLERIDLRDPAHVALVEHAFTVMSRELIKLHPAAYGPVVATIKECNRESQIPPR